jgi:DNA-binding LacI/PurR family transcriptional regulator
VQGYDLVALIFVREVSDPLTGLVKQIEKQMAETLARAADANKLGVFIIFCNDDAGLKGQLEDLIAKKRLKQVVLCATNAEGPPRYRVAKEADFTVVIYEDKKVTANFALKKGALDKDKSKEIVKALTQVLPKK